MSAPVAPLLLAVMLWLVGPVSADVARVADLRIGDQLLIRVDHIGTIPTSTVYTFLANEVRISQGDKYIGSVTLSHEDEELVDRYLDLVRDGRFGTGNGSNTYTITLIKDGRERRSLGERHRIIYPARSKKEVLSFHDLHKRLAK